VRKYRIIAGGVLLTVVALFMMALAEGGAVKQEMLLSQVASSPQGGARHVVGTLSPGDIESREDRARKYRSCLFTYLPRMGSDVAAEIIRDACKAEYMATP